jgi:hypothetical protein
MKVYNWKVFTKMLYSRMFFATGDGDYKSRRGLDNELLGLLVEDLDEATAEGIRMGEHNTIPFLILNTKIGGPLRGGLLDSTPVKEIWLIRWRI